MLRNQFLRGHKGCSALVAKLFDDFIRMSQSKFGSNICENLVTISDSKTLRGMIRNILKTNYFEEMMYNQFGNFIVQLLITKLNSLSRACTCPQCVALIPQSPSAVTLSRQFNEFHMESEEEEIDTNKLNI